MVLEDKNAGEQVLFISTSEIAIQEIWFTSSKDIEKANIIIESSKEIQGISKVNNAYEYETIAKLGISDEDLSNFKIIFRIKSEWVNTYSQNDTIKLNYYDNNWISVNATYKFSDALYDYYEASPKKLSYFSISGDEKRKTPIPQKESNIIAETKENINEVLVSQTTKAKDYLSNKNIIIYSMIIGALLITIIIIYYFFNMISKGEYLENLKEAEDFIDEELAEGISKKDIEKDLEQKGWPKKVVEKLVHKHHMPPDAEVKIKSSIQTMKNGMMKDSEIKKALVAQGWSSDIIDEIMNEFSY